MGRSAVMGDVEIILSCNSIQSSDVTWTRNTTRGEFNYVYVNGNITDYLDYLNRFYMVNASSLRLYIPEDVDSGLYDCHDTDGRRIVGYNLTVTRTYIIVSPSK